MRVLAVLYCYPPLQVPAAMCYLKLVLGLTRLGVSVDIVTITPESFEAYGHELLDETLVGLCPREVGVHAVRSPESRAWLKLLKRLDPSRRLLYRALEPKKREWTVPAYRHLRKLDLSRYDVLLTCSQPHANHLLGLRLKRETGLPWIAYFSDPWSNNPYMTYPSQRVAAYNRHLEAQVLEHADRVLFTSEEMLRLVTSLHPEAVGKKAAVLPHAFVSDWYGDDPRQSSANGEGAVRLLHTGHFYGPRTPMPILNALVRLREEIDLEGRLLITSFGSMGQAHVEAVRRAGMASVFRIEGVVPYLESLRSMRQHDYLLLVDAKLTRTSESVFLPSKLIDYLGSMTPVIAVTPACGASARVVRETGGIVCDIEDEVGLAQTLKSLVEAGRLPATSQPEKVAAYECTNVAGRLVGLMRELVGPDESAGA